MKNNTKKIIGSFIAFSFFVLPAISIAEEISFPRYLNIGMRGDDVKLLQTILAAEKTFYPEGLVTGYYGQLTYNAVKRFQTAYGVPSVGVVGPKTIAKIKEVVSSASMNVKSLNASSPAFIDVVKTPTANSVAISWKTDVPTTAKIWFGAPSPLNTELNPIKSIDLSVSRSANFNGLATSTEYYFVIYAEDAKGHGATSTEYAFTTLAQ
jgi:peptidoglycan hydrolase-like protein with peptidoglycan-binding domain